MKSYAERHSYYRADLLPEIELQSVGVYYRVPVKDLTEEWQKYCEEDQEYELVSQYDIDKDCLENYDNLEYDYTDDYEITEMLNGLMNPNYNHYLVVLFNSTWNNASGCAIFNDYQKCFYRSYDCHMYVSGSSKNGKYLRLCESHHDKPCGHTTLIMGLTDREYEKIDRMDIDEVIDFGKSCLEKIIDL